MISVCIFEDREVNNLAPITHTQAVYDTMLGATTIFEKIYRYFENANISLHCRDYLKSVTKLKYPDTIVNNINMGTPCLFINGRLHITEDIYQELSEIDEKHNMLFTYQGDIVAAYIRGELLEMMRASLNTIPSSKELIQFIRPKAVCKELDHAHMIKFPWDLLQLNSEAITSDFLHRNQRAIIKASVKPFTSIYNENNVFIEEGTTIEDFVVINAETGPVFIDKNVHIEANTRLEGPLYIGPNTQILGGKIKNSSIGAHCKLSGEITSSIINSYTNKAHTGFIGNSYIGSWVNLGALTTTSNLKNNYNPVTVVLDGIPTTTDQVFLGSIIGDYTKTGIGTILNTGTIIGTGSTIFDAGFHDKDIQSFSWGKPGQYTNHNIDSFYKTLSNMMKRRNKKVDDALKEVIDYLYNRVGIHVKQ
jgi:UDP-N-acetylglucosamine diphosphorylase / glucose-1-phosphate thymidylyltransferase / UDP-N-acetylgalactosamine diphosphorylase / glucosamine-1-phosphate N-acetyltransferase / galactosamine-1-phosphate N-acetyltransferase